MNRTRITLALVGLLVSAPVFAQTDISGDWDVTISSAQGTNSVTVTFKQEGDKVSGIFKSPMGELPFQGGTLTGNDLKFGFSIPIQGQPLDVTMTGTVTGPSIAGKAQFGGFGEGDWTAKRIESTTAAAPAAAAAAPAAAAPAAAAVTPGLSGKWDLTLKTQMGDVPVTAEFVESAGKVSGSLMGPMGPVDVAGTFDGNALKLEFTAKTPQGDIPVSMVGEYNGDSIVNGKADFGGMGQGEWTAKKKQ
ncbi:MAG TPA: hypothetical protein VH583_05375 [Vicinamibacterales bacterium]|jgi:hypothetical protein